MIHMTSTFVTLSGDQRWACRCGAGAGGFDSLASARTAGDAHLEEANSGE